MREMKDSGIEWIGEIPKDWTVIKLKHLCKITDGTHFSPQTTDVGKPYITVSNVANSRIDIQGALTISEEDFETLGVKFELSYKGAAALYYRTIQKIRKSIEGGDKR